MPEKFSPAAADFIEGIGLDPSRVVELTMVLKPGNPIEVRATYRTADPGFRPFGYIESYRLRAIPMHLDGSVASGMAGTMTMDEVRGAIVESSGG
jgi:hypothetical protein